MNFNKNIILFFDLDGTLVHTDLANFLSYKQAIESVIGRTKEIEFNPAIRFNRSMLRSELPGLEDIIYDMIIHQKEIIFSDYLSETKVNKEVAEVLLKYSKTNKTILITNCRKERALSTLDYHNLTENFSDFFFRHIEFNKRRQNKYKNALESLKLIVADVVIFENEEEEIEDAINAGILINNIFKF